mgnify:CR=1 FL=1
MATGPIETHLHRSFNWENGAPGPQEGPRGRSARCGNGLFAQCVRLRSEINQDSIAKAYGKNAAAPSASCTRNAKEHAKRIIEHMVADLICKSKRPRRYASEFR